MRKRIILLAALCALAAAGCGRAPAPPAEAPAVAVDRPDHDLGPIKPGSEHTARWTVRNAGKGPLKVTMAQVSCGCTEPTLKKGESTVVAPGGEYEIRATLKVNDTQQGRLRKTLTLATDDPAHPEIDLAVLGRTADYVVGLPARIHIPYLLKTNPFRASFIVHAPPVADFRITAVDTPEGRVAVTYARATAAEVAEVAETGGVRPRPAPPAAGHASYRVTLEIPAGTPSGTFSQRIVFTTNVAEMPKITITASGVVVDALPADVQVEFDKWRTRRTAAPN